MWALDFWRRKNDNDNDNDEEEEEDNDNDEEEEDTYNNDKEEDEDNDNKEEEDEKSQMSENAMTWRLIKLVGKSPSKAELSEIKDIVTLS